MVLGEWPPIFGAVPERPVGHGNPMRDAPLAVATLEPVDEPEAGREVQVGRVRLAAVHRHPVRLDPRGVGIVEVDELIADEVHRRVVLLEQWAHPFEVRVDPSGERSVLVVRVVVVAAANELEVHPVDATAVARDHAPYLGLGEESFQLVGVVHPSSIAGARAADQF